LYAVYNRSFRLDKIGHEHFVSKKTTNPADNLVELVMLYNNDTYKIIRVIDVVNHTQSVKYFKLLDNNFVSVKGIRGLCPYNTAIKTSIIFGEQYSLLGGSLNDLTKNLHHIFNNKNAYDYNSLTSFFKYLSNEINKWSHFTDFTLDLQFNLSNTTKKNPDVDVTCIISANGNNHEEYYPQNNALINCLIRLALFNKYFNNHKSWMIFDYSYLSMLDNDNKLVVKNIMNNLDNVSFIGILDGEHNKQLFCNDCINVTIL
jgi:hypothetical protein